MTRISRIFQMDIRSEVNVERKFLRKQSALMNVAFESKNQIGATIR